MTDKTKPSSFTTKDYLSLIFSVIALIFSGLNFYYSNLKIDDNLQARFYIAYLEPPLNDSVETGLVQVALFNMGNRQAIFVNSVFEFAPSLDDSAKYILANDFDNSKDFPIVLQPHEVKMINLKVSFKKNGEIILNDFGRKTIISFKEASLKIRLIALDSKAALHGANMENLKVDIQKLNNGKWDFSRHRDISELVEDGKTIMERLDKTTIIFKE